MSPWIPWSSTPTVSPLERQVLSRTVTIVRLKARLKHCIPRIDDPNTSRRWKKIPQTPVLDLSNEGLSGGPFDSDIDNDLHEGTTMHIDARPRCAKSGRVGGTRT